MKKTVTILSLIGVIIIAGVVLVLTGVIDIQAIFGRDNEPEKAEPAAFIKYMDSYVTFDDTGTVTSIQKDKPQEIPEVTGIGITKVINDEPLETSSSGNFLYVLEVIRTINDKELEGIKEIFASTEGEITLYVKNVRIQMGREDDTKGKLEALSNFYDQLLEFSGVLDLTEGTNGYVLKPATNLEN